MRQVFMRGLLALVLAAAAWSGDAAWNGGAGGANDDWSTAQNWDNNNPGPNGATAGAVMSGSTDPAPVLDAAVILNRLVFDSATAFDILGPFSLTMAGTAPIIEVRQGAHSISAPFAVTGDLTIVVYNGASLTIDETAISGTGTIIKVGAGTLTLNDSARPALTTWVQPSTASTTDTTPTWEWAGSGGRYRYRLDGGGWVETTATQFTPSLALGDASHTLEVEERDPVGWSGLVASRSVTIDGTAPYIVLRETVDADSDGFIDGVDVTFSEDMDQDAARVGSWAVAGYTLNGLPIWQAARRLRLNLNERTAPDTGATPATLHTQAAAANERIRDLVGNSLASETSPVAPGDKAKPIIVRVEVVVGSKDMVVVFSEPVTDEAGGQLSELDFSYQDNFVGGTTGISNMVDANGQDGQVTLYASGAVDAGDIGVDAILPVTTQINDLAGNDAVNTAPPCTLSVPATYFYSKVGGGPWNLAATWEDGRLPNQGDDIYIRGPVTMVVNDYMDCRSITFGGAGALSCSGAVPTAAQYCLVRIFGATDQIRAVDDTTVTDITLWDCKNLGLDNPITITVDNAATLRLDGTNQGQWLRTVIKRGGGVLEWNSPPQGFQPGWDVGPTQIEQGTLRLLRLNGRPDGQPLTIFGTGTLDLQQPWQISNLTGQGIITCDAGSARTLTLAASTWGGKIQDGTGQIVVDAYGTHDWSGINTFTGGLTIRDEGNAPAVGGSLLINGGRAIADGCPVTLDGTLTLKASETFGALSLADLATIVVDSGDAATVSGAVDFDAPLTVTGGGSVAFTGGASTGSSVAAVQAVIQGGSTLRIARSDHLRGSQVHLDGSTLAVDETCSITQDLVITNGLGTAWVASGKTATVTGDIGSANPLAKTGPGVLVIASAGTSLRTDTRIQAGELGISAARHLGAVGGGTLTMSGGGVLRATANVATTWGLTINAGGGALAVDSSQTLTWSGALGGGGPLDKRDAGILVLSADNTPFTGAIAVSGGTLRARHATALGATGAGAGTTVADGASLDLDLTANGTIGEPLTLGGSLTMDDALTVGLSGTIALTRVGLPASIDVGNAGGTLTASNTVSGSTGSGLAKSGAGVLALSGANTFTGQVSVLAGTLGVSANGGLGNAANEVLINGGTLRANGTVTSTRIVRIGSADGTIDTNNQTITLPGIDTTPGQDLTVTGTGLLVFAVPSGQIRTLGGRLGGTAALRLDDAGGGGDPGMLVIGDDANTWSGTCTVTTGRLTVNGRISGSLAVQSGGLVAGNGTVGALTVATGGTVSPGGQTGGTGSGPGVLKAASAALADGSLLRFDLGSANDLLSVTGSATFAGTTSVLTVTGSPSAAAFNANTSDLVLVAAGGMTYPAGAIGTVNYGTGITTQANYRVAVDGFSLLLQRNRAPTVATGVAATITPPVAAYADGTTTPPSYTVGPPGSEVLFNADVDAGAGVIPLVQATDPEGVAASSIVFTLKLDPGQGRIEWDADPTAARDWRTVTADTAPKTWTQQDIADGRVRYISTGSVGGTDAILYEVEDALGATSPLYLMRFAILGNGPPVISSLPAPAAVWQEAAVKPGAWGAIAPSATITDADTPILTGGLLQFDLLNGESGDELSFVGDGIAIAGGSVSVAGVPIGTLVAGATSLAVTLNDAASLARVQLLLRSASFRTANQAPVANGRSVTITTKDGSVGGATNVYPVTLVIDLYNDAPSQAMTVDLGGVPTASTWIAAVPGIDRSGTLTPSDPEGVGLASITQELRQSPLYGTLTWSDGVGARTFTYRAGLLSAGQTADVIEDSFVIRTTDIAFDDVPQQRKVGSVTDSRDAARYADHTIRVRISCSGTGMAFLNVPRMTVDNTTVPAGSFSYLPELQRPAGSGTIVFELIDRPAGITLGSGPGQLLFIPATGAISWPAVPAPTPPYWRFGILATDLSTGGAALQPIMLRVGPGGTNG